LKVLYYIYVRKYAAYDLKTKTRKNAIVEFLDYQIPVTQLSQGPRGNGDMQAAKRD